MGGRLLTDVRDRRIPEINGFDEDKDHPAGTVPERNAKSTAICSTPRLLRGYNVPHTGVGDKEIAAPQRSNRCVGFGILIAVRIAGTRTNAWRPRGPVGACCLSAPDPAIEQELCVTSGGLPGGYPIPTGVWDRQAEVHRVIWTFPKAQRGLAGRFRGRMGQSTSGSEKSEGNWRLSPWARRSYDETLAQRSRLAATNFAANLLHTCDVR